MAPEKIDQIMEAVSLEAKDIFDEFSYELRTKFIREGIRKGIEKGIEKGFEKGFEKGIEQGLKEIITVNMITKGYSDEQIVEITNLSIKRIQVLRRQ